MAPAGEGDPNSSYTLLLDAIAPGARVLDLGCGPGSFARQLAAHGCAVTAVDVNPDHVAMTRPYCVDARVVDLERQRLEAIFPTERFDVAICADVLEHVRNPLEVLASVRRVLAPGGYVLASIPNIAHGAVRLALLEGRFDYAPFGILDDTHVRFYTRATATALLESAGYHVEAIARTTEPLFDPAAFLVPVVDRDACPADAVAIVEADPDATTLQFVLKGVPLAAAEATPPPALIADDELGVFARMQRAMREADAILRQD